MQRELGGGRGRVGSNSATTALTKEVLNKKENDGRQRQRSNYMGGVFALSREAKIKNQKDVDGGCNVLEEY